MTAATSKAGKGRPRALAPSRVVFSVWERVCLWSGRGPTLGDSCFGRNSFCPSVVGFIPCVWSFGAGIAFARVETSFMLPP